jgi:hypothetical protein
LFESSIRQKRPIDVEWRESSAWREFDISPPTPGAGDDYRPTRASETRVSVLQLTQAFALLSQPSRCSSTPHFVISGTLQNAALPRAGSDISRANLSTV